MSSETTSRSGELVPVKFSRLSRRGIILGLSTTQLVTLGIGILTLVAAFYAGGGLLIAYTAPVWVLSAALTWIPVAGRPVVEWLPVVAWWGWRATGGQLLYRRRIVAPRPAGTLALPGDMARLREYTDPETGAGMIHDPHHATLTVVCEVSHPAFVLLDPAEQERRVTAWGRVLATVCRSGRISTLQVLERTLPDSGTGLAEWWAEHGTADGSWAATTYAELIDRAGPAGERHATTISLSLDMKAAARQIRTAGGHLRGGATVLRQEMGTLTAALRAADLAPSGWLTPGKIAVILRSAYDPAIASTLERHGELGQSLATAGPVAVTESWSQLRTDQAVRDIRKKKVEHISDAAQRRKIGQIEDASQTAEYTDVLQQEADLTAGHGLLRITGFISISASTVEELDAAVSQVEQAAIQASCETRRLVGQQAAAFTAAALPLCRRV